MTTAVEQLTAAIESMGESRTRSMTVEMVCSAAELFLAIMDTPATIEWCDHHGRPHEFCELIDAASCTPRVRAVGPEVALWT